MDIDNIWTFIENGIEYNKTEIEYFWYLIREIPMVLNTQDIENMLYLLWDLEEFVAEAISLPHIETINKIINLIKSKIHGSNTSAERMLLWVQNLDTEDTIDEQHKIVIGAIDLGLAASAA